jgi:hypothetical protein
MRAIAFGLKKAACFEQKHTCCKQEKNQAPPVGMQFFHSKEFV